MRAVSPPLYSASLGMHVFMQSTPVKVSGWDQQDTKINKKNKKKDNWDKSRKPKVKNSNLRWELPHRKRGHAAYFCRNKADGHPRCA